ncbi:cation acetate symporter [Actinoplanes sp. ATCC 53533]|uniref:sodium/solute symporter n=1 Tax=Actinoplanes sp. ATCC 53533 TaxID=1288362 RepID=UPI000F7B1ED0|nr:cation acetate symporter [Actinoplanes sp. ATCC 53533]RSM47736.1 cation acetate symporter [Actinoplanes sp. ATCC 53533]
MNPYVVPGLVLVVLITVGIGAYGLRFARTTSDFLVASRSVSPTWNAAAISGEYLSAASFLGIAGLVLRYGIDVLWYPVGFAAGYLALLLFVAAPLRRSGAFTLPDFCEVRLRSPLLRRLATVFVVFICCLYLVPQLQGAGLTFTTVTGGRYEWGALLVGLIVTANVALGGMRAITFVQAFQYWLKLTALAVPVLFLVMQWQSDGRPAATPPAGPAFAATTTVTFSEAATLTLPDGTQTRVAEGEQQTFPAGATVPDVSSVDDRRGADWLLPGGDTTLFATYSLILATFLGTMGLPHVLVRFYTNPDGASARRTTLVVLALVGLFYLLPTLYGVLGRIYTPQLLMTGRTDAVVLLLPEAALGGGHLGRFLGALVTAGALAAFMSTASGLLTSVAGVVFTDIMHADRGGSVRDFRLATVLAAIVPMALSVYVANMDVSRVVGLAFAVAASSFCPLLVLGIWWRGLTDVGAVAGILAGGGAAMASVLITVLGPPLSGWPAQVIEQPAAWTVPLAFLVMVAGSLLTKRRVPRDIGATMLRLHAPESLRL